MCKCTAKASHKANQLYRQGVALEKQGRIQEAIVKYRQALYKRSGSAGTCLGLLAERGQGQPVSLEKAFAYYSQAAELQEPSACYNLARCYAYGIGTDQDLCKAVGQYEKAAELGSSAAMYALGIAYGAGQGIEKSLEKSQHYYASAAKLGHGKAKEQACRFLAEQAFAACKAKRFSEATEKYYLAAHYGSGWAANNLGYMYATGFGENKAEPEIACQWYRKAIELKHAGGHYNLGIMYEFGRGVEQSFASALDHYQQARTAGYAMANVALARLYSRGNCGSPCQAIDHLKQGVAAGLTEAYEVLGHLYEFGKLGVEKSAEEAARLYTVAAERGNLRAQVAMGRLAAQKKDWAQVKRWAEMSAEKHDPAAYLALAGCYRSGLGVQACRTKALHYYQLAARCGLVQALCELPRFCLDLKPAKQDGPHGLEAPAKRFCSNENKVDHVLSNAAQLLRRAELDDTAQVELGDLCLSLLKPEQGVDELKRWTQIALDYYKMAASRGNAEAQHKLATLSLVLSPDRAE